MSRNIDHLAGLSARTMATLVRRRIASPIEIVEAVLTRIERVEPGLNAFVALDAERVREAARQSEALMMQDRFLGPLHGVPVTVKDVEAVAGLPTRRGSRLTATDPAEQDSPAVARLRAAGALILGKTAMTEHGWTAVSDSPLTGATHNPWKPGFTSGGSSAGAAALAGAGCGPLHLGTDGAGSVRIPAHFCGVVGFKPSFGRVPYVPVPNNGALSHIGPLARDVPDAALMLEVMAGPHAADFTTLPSRFLGPDFERAELKGLRVAYSPTLGHARVDPDVADLVSEAARAFADLGAHVEEVAPDWGAQGPDLIRALWASTLLGARPADAAAADAMDQGLVACLRDSEGVSLADVQGAQARRIAYAAAIGHWFDCGWDLLLTPAASVAAFELGRQRPAHWPDHVWDWISWAEFSYPFNLAHNPAISVPCGLTKAGLPVGLQIVGPRHEDAAVMAAAHAYLTARPFRGRPYGDGRPSLSAASR
jgi:aspartyl-tRNA(Asn)/glutamyl-tRNA(Gln) amidotransferase subunit A